MKSLYFLVSGKIQIKCCDFFDVKNSRLEIQTTEREKIFAMHLKKGNAYYSECIRNFYKSVEKWNRNLNRLFTRGYTVTSNHKYVLRLISYKGKAIKTTITSITHLLEWLKLKTENTKCW